ncbi:uncharacterized protein LOC105701772 [Orussus abietinus]|uniref:uncharacterized protein LOC105701772 n=1 Tax=Orussus abietinus TaxID=222816 RepID=UPI000625FAE7|nr:uncharacterized protein LOC105701772 [Orussus abietinus]
MQEKEKKPPGNHLRAEELLKNRGIRTDAWEEWEKSIQTLPKTGCKQYESNGSWLQNRQIDASIKNRKELLGIERVERSSQLAAAEWLSDQSKALVTKRSGQDWSAYGLEEGSNLYLIPEEALLLLELNCLELTWNGLALSVQQAYEVLIGSENSTCSLNEYRVYSQLAKQGYRLQRFNYEQPNYEKKTVRFEEPVKRKVIGIPETGLRVLDSLCGARQSNDKTVIDESQNSKDQSNGQVKNSGSTDETKISNETPASITEDITRDIMDSIICQIENKDKDGESSSANVTHTPATSKNSDTIMKVVAQDSCTDDNSENSESKRKNSKIEIISDEILVDNMKIRKNVPTDSTTVGNPSQKWISSRIQRNVKLLPKRNHKVPVPQNVSELPDSSHLEASSKKSGPVGNNADKRKLQEPSTISSEAKRSRHEVIELSDDEIEEIPHRMTRMEMLNMFPNIAIRPARMRKISTRYLPLNVKPKKTSYEYVPWAVHRAEQIDMKARESSRSKSNTELNNRKRNQTSSSASTRFRTDNLESAYYNRRQNFQNFSSNRPPSSRHSQFSRPRAPFLFVDSEQSTSDFFGRSTCIQRNVMHNTNIVSRGYGQYYSRSNTVSRNGNFSMQVDNYTNIAITENPMRMPFMAAHFQQNPWQIFAMQQNFWAQRMLACLTTLGMQNCFDVQRNQQQTMSPRRLRIEPPTRVVSIEDDEKEVNKPSFVKDPDTSSWFELKKKWIDEKTITIDDEDRNDLNESADCNDVEVVNQPIKPLVDSRNSRNFVEVFERLRIIKPAAEKTVRRRRGQYKISYNVYSSMQHFRKSQPGVPICRLVVLRQKDPFVQPVELARLQQDSKGAPIVLACVSNTSVAFLQPGVVSLPNLN